MMKWEGYGVIGQTTEKRGILNSPRTHRVLWTRGKIAKVAKGISLADGAKERGLGEIEFASNKF